MSMNLVSVGTQWREFLDLKDRTASELVQFLDYQFNGVLENWELKKIYCRVVGIGAIPPQYRFGTNDDVDVVLDPVMAAFWRYTDAAEKYNKNHHPIITKSDNVIEPGTVINLILGSSKKVYTGTVVEP